MSRPPSLFRWFASLVIPGLLCLPATSVLAQAARYQLDPVHTRVMVAISHAGFSEALGTVSGSEGTLAFDPGDWHSARVDITVPLARIDFGDADWNKAVQARNLLDVARHPQARFVSNRIEPIDAQHFIAYGQLTLHGVTHETALDVRFNQLKRHPLPPFRRTAGFSATAKLSRAAFGIDAWTSVIGDTVTLRIEAEATRRGKADLGDAGEEAPEAMPAPAATPAADDAATAAAEAAADAAAEAAEPSAPPASRPPEPTP
ncbi:MAG: YceI family protein [Pseudoxanthomonas sp.]